MMKHLILGVGLLACCGVHAQTVTGFWYGQANVEMSGIQNNYLTELIISQKGNKVRGFFGYYFKDVYESFLVKGTYDPATRQVVIKNIPIIYFNVNSTAASVDCITSFYGKLLVSKVKTSLIGYFYRDKKYEYTCPDLRVNYTLWPEAHVEDSVFKEALSMQKTWKATPGVLEPQAKPEADTTQETPTRNPTYARVATGRAVLNPKDSATHEGQVASGLPKVGNQLVLQQTFPADLLKIDDDFKKRKTLISKELVVSSDSIRLSFYDDAIIDGDSISVFFNSKLLIAHQELSDRAFNLYIRLDSLKDNNEVSMFAENLGKYPPNTALMVVNDGENRYEVFMSSDFNGNATVRFKRRRH